MTDVYAARRGERRPAAKMTEATVRAMRDARATRQPRPSMRELAAEFGLSKSTTHAILSGRTWKHVS